MSLVTLISLILTFMPGVWSHARLLSPPSRSSLWRFGFPTPINFNDNELYCGGFSIQWIKNGGKCGICGDPYNMPHPRENEAGGKYGLGIISKRYITGQVINVTVDVSTNHRGYFEFKLCPNNNPKKEATQECLDKYLLKEAHGSGTRYYLEEKRRGEIPLLLQLPKGLICSQCVLQWTYVAGNNWGNCPDGNSGLGCGPQETFRGCADIAIHEEGDPAVFDVKPNEIDVESNFHEILNHKNKNDEHKNEKPNNKNRNEEHKNEKPNNKNNNEDHKNKVTNVEFVTYSYEVSKQTRQNPVETKSIKIQNLSDDSDRNMRYEKNILARSPEKPLTSINKGYGITEHAYAYEVSKQTRQNSSESKSTKIQNHSRDNDANLPFERNYNLARTPENSPESKSTKILNHSHDIDANMHFERNYNLARTPEKTLTSYRKGYDSSERRPQSSTNRRKNKHHNRNLYHFKNIKPFHKNPFDQNWDYFMNNNRFPLSFGQIKVKGHRDQINRKQDARLNNPKTQFKQMKFPLIIFSDSEEDSSVSDGFVLRGRRYKDFWLL